MGSKLEEVARHSVARLRERGAVFLRHWVAPALVPRLAGADPCSSCRTTDFATRGSTCGVRRVRVGRIEHVHLRSRDHSLACLVTPGDRPSRALRRVRPGISHVCPARAIASRCAQLPALWVAYEYLSEFRSPHGTFGNLAYTQMDFLPIQQIVSLTGIWSISFLLFLLPAAVAAIFAPAAALRQKIAVALGALLVFAGVLGFGWQRLHSGSQGPAVRIALIDTDNLRYPEGEASLALVRAYAEHIPSLARAGAQVVVIPEKIGRFNESEVGESDRILEQAAQDNHVTLVAGLLHQPNLNEARIYSPQGSLEATYEKHHMLPPFESDLVAGKTRTLLHRPSGRWGVEICKDMDFPALSRQYGADGIGLLLVPAWDFVADGWLHGRMAILRGVESGFSIARSAKQGILTITDDRGRVLAQRTTGSAGFDTVVADVPVANERTFYVRAGDWFVWFDMALLAIIFLSPALRTLRTSRPKQEAA